jgi:hypothetical protein
VWALLLIVLALAGATAYGLAMGHQRQAQVDALAEQLSTSDEAAVEVASQRQAQARTVLELCESGAIEQDDAGVAVCDEAERAAQEDPAQAVAQAKGEQGPQGPRGPAGPSGADGTDGADGKDGDPGETGPAGADGTDGTAGTDGADGEQGAPGPTGAPGESGKAGKTGASGSDGKPGATGAQGATGAKGDPGPTGPQGATGERGPQGETGPAGKDGADGSDGRGIDSATCSPDTGRWTITYTDDTSEDAGPCIATTPDAPAPTPTPTEEVTP